MDNYRNTYLYVGTCEKALQKHSVGAALRQGCSLAIRVHCGQHSAMMLRVRRNPAGATILKSTGWAAHRRQGVNHRAARYCHPRNALFLLVRFYSSSAVFAWISSFSGSKSRYRS